MVLLKSPLPFSPCRHRAGTIALTFLTALIWLAPSALAAPSSGEAFEVQEYQADFGVSEEAARDHLETQEDGTGLPETLASALGARYAGIWFDNTNGEFVVPVVPSVDPDRVGRIAETYQLEGDFRTKPATFVWDELEAEQKRLSALLDEFSEYGLTSTSLRPRSNAVAIRMTAAATPKQEGVIQEIAEDSPISVEIEHINRERFEVEVRACITAEPRACDKPLRGGVGIGPYISNGKEGVYTSGECTAGFKAVGNTFGNRFILTAGHCPYFLPNIEWASNTAKHNGFYDILPIGTVEESTFGPTGDWAKIRANGSEWDTANWPSLVAHYWENQEYPIHYESPSYQGQYVCLSGNKSGTSCGNVQELHVEELRDTRSGKYLPAENEVTGLCVKGGDSGGPIFSFSSNTALGMLSASDVAGCLSTAYYVDITTATENLGVTVGARIGAPPEVKTFPASNVQAKTATFNGLVNPNGLPTDWTFEYGTTTAYGKIADPGGSLQPSWQPVGVSQLEYLKPNTTYHYRLYAYNPFIENPSGYGRDQQFTTPAIPPVVKTDNASAVTATSATVLGWANPEETHTTARIEYGATSSYGMSAPVPPKDMGEERESKPLLQSLTNLTPATTYHYRIAATNDAGQTSYGANATFTTPTLAPLVETKAATNSNETSVVMRGTVNPQGSATTYQFQYGLTTAYGSSAPVPQGSAGSGGAASDVSQLVSGLVAGQTYHYRLVATNSFGTRIGGDQLVTAGWTNRNLPNPAGGNQAGMTGVSCAAPTSCMAVGSYTAAASGITFGVAERWDGSKWTPLTVPDPAPNTAISSLTSVSCPTSSFCQAVGYYFTTTGGGGAYAARWDGSKWTAQSVENPAGYTTWLFGVSCISPTFCQAGGYKGTSAGQKTFVQQWNGTKWSEIAVPSVEGAQATLLESMSCTSTTRCVGVGSYQDTASQQHPVALHWDGAAWTLRTPPTPNGFKTGRLMAVSCGSSTECQATGVYLTEAGLRAAFADRLVGGTWSALPIPYLANARESWLMGVSCESQATCLATGIYENQAGQTIPLAARWTGSTWEPQSPPYIPGNIFSTLESVSCVSLMCMAAGYTKATTIGPTTAVASEYHMPVPVPGAVTEAASNVTGSAATLNATIQPNGLATTYRFEYGPTTSYGSSAPIPAAAAGSGQQAVLKSTTVSGLAAQTTYHYRVVATNAEGSTYGNNVSLKTAPSQYQSAFGTTGTGNGQFNHPADVAIDSKSNIWIVDKENNRLQQFNEQGQFLKAVGGLGVGAGKLSSPSSVGIDYKGSIFVSDTMNNRIVQFNERGEFVLTFGRDVNKTKVEAGGTEAQKNLCTAVSGNVCQAGKGGSATGQFSAPKGVALTAGGNLMVVDYGNSRVQKVSPEGVYLAKIGSLGSGPAQLKEPSAVAVAPDASIWVADSGNNRLQQWTSTFELIRQVGSAGSGNGQFNRPIGVEAGADGKIWVGDEGGDRIEAFNGKGEYLRQFGVTGSGPAQFKLADPMGIAIDAKGFIWVTDTDNDRIQKWTVE